MSSFTPSGSGGLPPQSVTISGATNPEIVQVPMAVASTEYPVVLPVGTRQYRLRLVDNSDLTVSYSSGGVVQEVPRLCFLAEDGLQLTGTLTLYLKSTQANQTAELVVWT